MQTSTGLPSRPKLRGYYHRVPLEGDRLLFEGPRDTVVLEGDSVRELLPLLLPYLDGRHTIEAIVSALAVEVEPSVTYAALRLLDEKHLLEDVDRAPPSALAGERERFAHQTTFWLSISNDRYAFQERLARARVAISSVGWLGSAVAEGLAAAGVGGLVLVDARSVVAADRLFGVGQGEQDLGRNRAVVVQELLAQSTPDLACDAVGAALDAPRDWAGLLAGCSLAVVCSDVGVSTVCEAVNAACLELGMPWTRASMRHHKSLIGPTVRPGQTACFTCLLLRLRSNTAFVADALAVERYLQERGDSSTEVGVLAPFASLTASYLVLEVVKLLTGFAHPASFGAMLALNCLTSELTRHEILKLPRCPSCGPARNRPQMKIWDIAPDGGLGRSADEAAGPRAVGEGQANGAGPIGRFALARDRTTGGNDRA